MRPYVVVAGDFVRTGGMDVANFHLARHLARRGAEVHLVAHRVAPELTAIPGVNWHRVAKPFGSYLLGEGLLDRTGRRWHRLIEAQGGRQVVNGGNCVSPDTNWVHYVHAGHPPEIAASGARRALVRLMHRRHVNAERRALAAAPLVIANSDRTRRDLMELTGVAPARIHTVYYGTDAEWHRPPSAAERQQARERLGWKDDRPGLVFVGALGDRRKAFDVVFSAWSALCRDREWDARLVVVGAGRELPEWKRRTNAEGLEPRTRFLGFTADVRAVLWACDAIVAPARYEAYGLAVHEAVSCGLAAVVSADAGVAERLDDLAALEPERPDDAEALAAALRRWRGELERWSRVAGTVSGRLRAWSWDDMAGRIVQLMETAP